MLFFNKHLLCLSDDERGEIAIQESLLPLVVPVIALSNAYEYAKTAKQGNHQSLSVFSERADKISLENRSKNAVSKNAFAVTLVDNSMHPKFLANDVVIVDSEKKPQSGDFVLAYVVSSHQSIVRKYRESEQHAAKNKLFELIALNPDWGVVRVCNVNEAVILATVVEHRAYL